MRCSDRNYYICSSNSSHGYCCWSTTGGSIHYLQCICISSDCFILTTRCDHPHHYPSHVGYIAFCIPRISHCLSSWSCSAGYGRSILLFFCNSVLLMPVVHPFGRMIWAILYSVYSSYPITNLYTNYLILT